MVGGAVRCLYTCLSARVRCQALIVRPSSSGQLSVGMRVCAYWSEKFSCLHPGKICEPSSSEDDDDDDDDDDDGGDGRSERSFNVDFDDGDAGKIPLDYIRMLPADFPLQRTYSICSAASVFLACLVVANCLSRPLKVLSLWMHCSVTHMHCTGRECFSVPHHAAYICILLQDARQHMALHCTLQCICSELA